ncbi:MAG: LPS export ABC transporter permease LptG [Rickettsiales bacterium]
MRLPLTLSYYIGKYFLLYIMVALFGLLAVTSLVDILELIRRAGKVDGVPFHVILSLALLKMPSFAIKLIPYAVLIGSMASLSRLTKTQELIIARSAGVSVWQFLSPAVILVFILGVFVTTVFNPFAAALMTRSDQMENRYLSASASLLAVSPSGLWLRQLEDIEPSAESNISKSRTVMDISEHIIHAARLLQDDMSFMKVIIFSFDRDKKFVERLDAKKAILIGDYLLLSEVIRSIPGKASEKIEEYKLPTSLTLEHIQDSFASPETISFWQLPNFIDMLEEAGFSALKHKLYWHTLLSSPFLMVGSVLIAAVFSLRPPRRGKIGILIVSGVITGFLIHFFSDIVFAFGAAGTIPISLAAWTPSLVVIMIGASLLLHLEDG